MSPRVGIVDGGFARVPAGALQAAAQFSAEPDGRVRRGPPLARALPHGECVAALVLCAAPDACLIDARVATDTSPPTPRLVADAIDWCVAEGARIVNLSLGVLEDRDVLRDACARAVALGVLLVAAAPARGAPVHPARYPGVIAVGGDARCGPGQWSMLTDAGSGGASWGSCPAGPNGEPGGASMAAARFTGIVAKFLAHHPDAGRNGLAEYLATFAGWRGRESRRIAEIDR